MRYPDFKDLKGQLSSLGGWRGDLWKRFISFGILWPVMLMGWELLSSHISPIYPAVRISGENFSNLWNPWAGGCPGLNSSTAFVTIINEQHDLCWGTNIARIGGPYSIFWYWTMLALAGWGKFYPSWNNLDPFFAINCLLIFLLRRRYSGYGFSSLMNLLYGWIAILFMIAFPQILLPLFFTAGSLLFDNKWLRALMLALAPIYRFPVGAPLYVWQFVFSFSIHVAGNALPYSLTILFWLVAFGSMIRRN